MQESFRVHINGKHTFFLDKRILCKFSGKLQTMVKQEGKRSSYLMIKDFPGGQHGFELVSRFCYSNGRIAITSSNISILQCSAFVLEMTEEISTFNLSRQAERFLDELPNWSWTDILVSLKCCNRFSSIADSSGLLERLVSALVAKISADADIPLSSNSSFSSSSSSLTDIEWWFNDLVVLSPYIIGKIVRTLSTYGTTTRFLLHYLNAAGKKHDYYDSQGLRLEYGDLADAVVDGVASATRTADFSCRGLFWVLRVVTGLGLSNDCRDELEKMIADRLDEATLDDLLVSGHDVGEAYDVSLVMRLVGIFVNCEVSMKRMRKVGMLMDKYLVEISPDHGLKASEFLGLAKILPDSSRDCFDGVYRALDIYLESHPNLSFEDRTSLCQCINNEKLTVEVCRDLARNPRIPAAVSVRALVAQNSKLRAQTKTNTIVKLRSAETPRDRPVVSADEKEQWRMNLHRVQWRLVELEVSRGAVKLPIFPISNRVKSNKSIDQVGRGLTRLC